MGTRRAARELALQALYQLDVAGAGDPGVALFWSHLDAERKEVEREEAERESAHAGRWGLGASEARSPRSGRALDGPPGEAEAERESAHAGRRGLGASEARSPRSGRALDGPPGELDAQVFARELVDGVAAHRERIDALIAASAEHWRLPRLSRVDLSLLRLATFELLARADIPASVTIDEAIEIARRFGSEDSPAFVNGVLDHIAQVLGVKEKPKSPE